MEIANGIESDGIKYICFLNGKNWVVKVSDNFGREKQESFPVSYAPRCGPDIADVNKAEIIMDKLINQIREINNECN